MKSLRAIVVFTLIVCGCLIGNAFGAVYYVTETGNDSNPGTEAQPWQTIQNAADTLIAGDTVYIKAGTYQERVVPQNSGTAGNYIVYAAYSGDTVTIDGATIIVPEWGGLFDITGKNYVRVSGLRILNAGPNPHNPGIQVDTASHVIIENNYVYNTSDSGIGVWNSDNVIVDGNEVEGACSSGWNECISVGNTDTFEVRNNLVYDSQKEGICAKDGSSNGKVFRNEVHHTAAVGFYVDASDDYTFNIEVFQNIAHDIVEDGFAIASEVGGLLENVKAHNNIAYNNGWVGLRVSDCCIASHPMRNIQIVNNTFYNNGWDYGGGIAHDNPQAEEVVIRNNICSQNLSFQIAVGTNVLAENYVVDHNLIDGYRGAEEGEIYGSDYVEGDPLVANSGGADFHLRGGSPAIDRGSSSDAPAVDFDAQPRPYGAGYDIGAYEYVPGNSFNIVGIATDLIGPPASGNEVQITFTTSPQSNAWYRWYARSGFGTQNPGNWQALEADWSINNSITWTPQSDNRHVVLAWIGDTTNRTNRYQAGLVFETEGYSANPLQITGMTSNLSFPQPSGTPITLHAAATGGSGTIYYKYFSKLQNSGWNELGGWSTSGAATWTPSQDGSYILVVHVSQDMSLASNPFNQAGMICMLGE